MKASRIQPLILLLISLSLSACNANREKYHVEPPKITVTIIQPKAVTLTQQYVGQIRSHHHINVRAPEAGYIDAIPIKEGQEVTQNDLLFQIKPLIDNEKLATKNEDKAVLIKAPFNGMVDGLPLQQGSLVQKGETLTTLSDNGLMWVYFNIPEARYLEFKAANLDQHQNDLKIELVLANGKKFDHLGKLGAIGAGFDFKTGNVAFRADFPNPDHLLRHGQTGTVVISEVRNSAVVIPQQATFEDRQKQYVYVVDKDDVAHQREIVVQNELDDQFVVKTGLAVGDKIVVDGVNLVHNGGKVECEDRPSKTVVAK